MKVLCNEPIPFYVQSIKKFVKDRTLSSTAIRKNYSVCKNFNDNSVYSIFINIKKFLLQPIRTRSSNSSRETTAKCFNHAATVSQPEIEQ